MFDYLLDLFGTSRSDSSVEVISKVLRLLRVDDEVEKHL